MSGQVCAPPRSGLVPQVALSTRDGLPLQERYRIKIQEIQGDQHLAGKTKPPSGLAIDCPLVVGTVYA